jgi:molybdopterin-guanine dinucleotide biosynthesis protein A
MDAARSLLDAGGGAAADLLPRSGADVVPVSVWAQVAEPTTCFLNINTPEERQRAEDLLASAKRRGASEDGRP